MKNDHFFLFFLLGVCSLFASLRADYYENQEDQIFVGPEIYHVERTKKAGAKQDGYLYGVRLGYERIKKDKIYVGVDFLYAEGSMKGKLGEEKIKSILTDINIEERIGYTLASNCGWKPSFTPYIGVGKFWEKNEYKHPSPFRFHFYNSFLYIPIGFLSHLDFTDNFRMGINFKARYILDSHHTITHDSEFGKIHQKYEEKVQYRVELPMTYFTCFSQKKVSVSLVPFYEYRHYGYRINFPFDFIETKFNLYGANLKLLYLF